MNVKELLLKVPQAVNLPASTPSAVIQYDVTEPVYHVIEGGSVRAVEGYADAPDVTIKVSDANLWKLFNGDLNPMSALMTGRLRVKGDVMLAQKLLGLVDRAKLEQVRAAIDTSSDTSA